MIQTLSTAIAQVKADNNLENLLNKIRQTVSSFYQSKEVPKKVYNNIIKSIQVQKTDTNFMKSCLNIKSSCLNTWASW